MAASQPTAAASAVRCCGWPRAVALPPAAATSAGSALCLALEAAVRPALHSHCSLLCHPSCRLSDNRIPPRSRSVVHLSARCDRGTGCVCPARSLPSGHGSPAEWCARTGRTPVASRGFSALGWRARCNSLGWCLGHRVETLCATVGSSNSNNNSSRETNAMDSAATRGRTSKDYADWCTASSTGSFPER